MVEVGSAFTAILVVEGGKIVDASAGTRGPLGLRSGGAWDGELAYWRSPLSKQDLFRGGLADLGAIGPDAFRESLIKHTAAMQAVTSFERIYLSGRGLEQPEVMRLTTEALAPFGNLVRLPSLPGAWVKHAAQGSAILADALAGGRFAPVADSLRLRSASGSVWDVLLMRSGAIADSLNEEGESNPRPESIARSREWPHAIVHQERASIPGKRTKCRMLFVAIVT